jgi:DNA-binding NarL/FixJ family response regulator
MPITLLKRVIPTRRELVREFEEKTAMNGEARRGERVASQARIVIADDHYSVRNGIKFILSGEDDIRVVGEAASGQEALELCRREHPELVLMDLRMPQMNGLTATREIKQQFPDISVLVLTVHENPNYLLEAIRAGAAGYVHKDAPQRELATAIRKVLDGEVAFPRKLATQLIQQLAEEQQKPEEETTEPTKNVVLLQPLTPRELEVLELLPLGNTNREIARHLVLSVGTVKSHVEHIMAKLGVSDRTQAVIRSLELGLIDFPVEQ